MAQGGWFVWRRRNGRIFYEKYSIDGNAVLPETRKMFDDSDLKKFPISQEEYNNMPLDALALKYPLDQE